MQTLSGERGLIGKLTLVWLLIAAVLVVAVIDGGSIALTRYHLSSIATNAASDGAASYALERDATTACEVAAASLHSEDPTAKITKKGCTLDTTNGAMTLKVKKQAKTILAGRLSFTRPYTIVTDTETNGPPAA